MTARNTASMNDQGSPATPSTKAGRDYDRGWMDRKLGLHRDANRQEANHYDRWFADGPPEVMDEQWLADTEAKMREALGDPFADDAAAVMLRLISTIREARAAVEDSAAPGLREALEWAAHIAWGPNNGFGRPDGTQPTLTEIREALAAAPVAAGDARLPFRSRFNHSGPHMADEATGDTLLSEACPACRDLLATSPATADTPEPDR